MANISWNEIQDRAVEFASKWNGETYEKGELEEYWKRFDALSPAKLIKTIYTEEIISAIRRKIKKDSGMTFDQTSILDTVHDLITCANKDVVKPKKLK